MFSETGGDSYTVRPCGDASLRKQKHGKLTDVNIPSIDERIFQKHHASLKCCVVGVWVCGAGGCENKKKGKRTMIKARLKTNPLIDTQIYWHPLKNNPNSKGIETGNP